MAGAQKSRVNRFGVWLYALSSAAITTVVVEQFLPGLHAAPLLIILVSLCIVFSFVWRWVFFERPEELDKKIPISSKELRRQKKEFFDSLR